MSGGSDWHGIKKEHSKEQETERKILCKWIGKKNAGLVQMSQWELKGEALYVILRLLYLKCKDETLRIFSKVSEVGRLVSQKIIEQIPEWVS